MVVFFCAVCFLAGLVTGATLICILQAGRNRGNGNYED